MSIVYLITESEVHGYDIDAAHTIVLPGVICPKCGTWARTGTAYPTVTKSMLGSLLPRLGGMPLQLQQFKNLKRALLELIGSTRPLFPGSQFDAAVGKMSGDVPDFAWSNPWTLFAQRRVFETLRDRGVGLSGTIAQLRTRKTESRQLVELEAVPRVRLHNSIITQQAVQECEFCGRVGIRKPEIIVLDQASLDASIPLQRIYELTSFVANAEFAEVIEEEQLRGVKVLPVEAA